MAAATATTTTTMRQQQQQQRKYNQNIKFFLDLKYIIGGFLVFYLAMVLLTSFHLPSHLAISIPDKSNHHHYIRIAALNSIAIPITVAEDDDHRPEFILHVGPHKTGTTFLQSTMCLLPRPDEMFTPDQFQYIGTCDSPYYPDCLEENIKKKKGRPKHACHGNDSIFLYPHQNDTFHPAFLELEQQARKQNKTTVMVVYEGLTPYSKQYHLDALDRLLHPYWKIHVVMNYRPFFDWRVSWFNQRRKTFCNSWPQQQDPYGNMGKDIPFNISDNFFWATGLGPENKEHLISVVKERYRPIADRITVVDQLHVRGGRETLTHLFCTVLSGGNNKKTQTPFLCQAAKSGQIENMTTPQTNPSFPIDYDLIAVAAWKQGLIPSKVPRTDAAWYIKEYQEVTLGKAKEDLEQKCVTEQQREYMWNITITEARLVFGGGKQNNNALPDNMEQDHAKVFQEKFPKLYCVADADKIVQNETWREFFKTIETKPLSNQ